MTRSYIALACESIVALLAVAFLIVWIAIGCIVWVISSPIWFPLLAIAECLRERWEPQKETKWDPGKARYL